MGRTLILYDGKMSSAERTAERLCYVVGNAKTAEIDEAPEDLSLYLGVCFVFSFFGSSVTAGKTKAYLQKHQAKLKDKRLAAVGIGYSDLGYTKYVVDMEREVGLEGFASYFIASDSQTTRTGYEIGRMMRVPAAAMDEKELLEEIRNFVEQHETLALATAADRYIRCTPLEYTFIDDVFYIATEGGNKFRGIIENGRVSAAIFDPMSGLKETASLQLLGEAEAVEVGSPEYQVAMTAKHITEERLKELPITMFLIRLTPLRYEYTNPRLSERGYDVSQSLNTTREKKNRREGEEYFVRERAKGQPTYTILDEHGEKKQVIIPEVGTSAIPGFLDMRIPEPGAPALPSGRKEELSEEERQRRNELLQKKRRKKALLEKRRREEALREAASLPNVPSPGQDTQRKDKDTDQEEAGAEAKVRSKAARESKKSDSKKGDSKKHGNVFSRLGMGIGKILQLEDEEEFGEEK